MADHDNEGYHCMEQGTASNPTPQRWIISPPPTGPWLALFARTLGLVSTALCILWIQVYNGGVGFHTKLVPAGGNDTGPIFGWHPILMMLAFAVFMAEAVLTYQSPLVLGIARASRKRVHYTLQSLALLAAALGAVAAFQSHRLKLPLPIPDMYTSHSYLGMATLALLASQYALGFVSYLFPGTSPSHRMALGPIHRFLGMATWLAGLASCAVGFQDRSSILQFTKASIYGAPLTSAQLKSPTLVLPATIELLLLLLAMAVLYHYVPPAPGSPQAPHAHAAGSPQQPVPEVEATAALKTGASKPHSSESQRSRHD